MHRPLASQNLCPEACANANLGNTMQHAQHHSQDALNSFGAPGHVWTASMERSGRFLVSSDVGLPCASFGTRLMILETDVEMRQPQDMYGGWDVPPLLAECNPCVSSSKHPPLLPSLTDRDALRGEP